jgi:rhamnosyltransferase subunit B
MKFVLANVGSAGDAHPYIAIGHALRARGHEVAFFSNIEHLGAAKAAGLEFLSAGDSLHYSAALADPNLWHPIKGMGVLWRNLLAPSIAPLYAALTDINRTDKSVRVLAGPQMIGARLAQAQLGLHLTSLYTSPAAFRSAQAPASIAHIVWPAGSPAWLLRGVWRAIDHYKLEPMARPTLYKLCAQLDISPPPQDQSLFGHWMHSPQRAITLYPEWFAPRKRDLPSQLTYGDFPHYSLDRQDDLAANVQGFLRAGSAPIAIMFGTAMLHAKNQFTVWQDALGQLGLRGIFLSAYEAQFPAYSASHILRIPYAPFSQLLPHCAALVHHGGIGSCAQALAAGIPQIIQPCAHDQFENARCVAALGAGRRLARQASTTAAKTALLLALRPASLQAALSHARRFSNSSLADLCAQLEGTP